MSLFTLHRIIHLIKTKYNNVNLECITCLIALKIKNVGLNLEKENELKQKKLEAHRQRVLNLSKKESKRPTKLAELNKELEETHAEEHKQAKNYKLTEIVKIIFAHVINLDFFADLIDVLNRVLETQEDLGYHSYNSKDFGRERLWNYLNNFITRKRCSTVLSLKCFSSALINSQ
uniref:Uncharacterized protein n=1 Tax=Glossina palpalis gambiensis TaxID=67801 RepID=A0A1B0C4M6_9MUSC